MNLGTPSQTGHGRQTEQGIRLYAFACGWLNADASMMLGRATGRIDFPIPAYLIEHPRGKLLFDTGLHRDVQKDSASRLGPWANLFRVTYREGEDIAQHLIRLNIDPARIETVAASHLHSTHSGGLEALPNARILIQKAEWDAAHQDDMIRTNNYNPRDYDHGHLIKSYSGEHDVFGDGTVVLFPCFGHTPGSQALKLRLRSGEVVLTSDACYFEETLKNLHLPQIVHNRSQMLSSLLLFRDLQRKGARILVGHDAKQWSGLPKAPNSLR